MHLRYQVCSPLILIMFDQLGPTTSTFYWTRMDSQHLHLSTLSSRHYSCCTPALIPNLVILRNSVHHFGSLRAAHYPLAHIKRCKSTTCIYQLLLGLFIHYTLWVARLTVSCSQLRILFSDISGMLAKGSLLDIDIHVRMGQSLTLYLEIYI